MEEAEILDPKAEGLMSAVLDNIYEWGATKGESSRQQKQMKICWSEQDE